MPAITAAIRDEIRTRLNATPIAIGQIDVNGKCNARCWYCPVKYQGNPAEFAVQMPISSLDHILGKLRTAKSIAPDFRFVYTSHYNEVLLYKAFPALLASLRRHGLATMILSNGTPLTPEKTDLILANRDVIWGIALNVPALRSDDWARKSGMPIGMHRLLLRNLDYLHQQNYRATIQINCATHQDWLLEHGQGDSRSQAETIVADFKARYPNFQINLQEWLSDRAGTLASHGALTQHQQASRPIIGCSHSADQGGRVFGWAHINARGELFLCCDDFAMNYRFGNLLEHDFDKLWHSEQHIDAILAAREKLCRRCQFRIEAPA